MAVPVIGFGSRWRGDDAVGPLVVERLRALGHDAREQPGDGLALAQVLRELGAVVVVDAMRSGRPPGTVVEIDALVEPLPRGVFPASTHVFGVAEGVDLARRLGWLPQALTVFGVEGADFSHGAGLSPAVEAAIPRLVALIAGR